MANEIESTIPFASRTLKVLVVLEINLHHTKESILFTIHILHLSKFRQKSKYILTITLPHWLKNVVG